jgi:uncharacterized protein YcfJ
LTPFEQPGVESRSCETPSQTRARRQAKRDACEKFITVRVPAHTKRVCAAEAGKLIGRKLGKKLGKAASRAIVSAVGLSKSKHVAGGRKPRAKRKHEGLRVTKRGGIEYGGFGVHIPKQFTNIGKGLRL